MNICSVFFFFVAVEIRFRRIYVVFRSLVMFRGNGGLEMYLGGEGRKGGEDKGEEIIGY